MEIIHPIPDAKDMNLIPRDPRKKNLNVIDCHHTLPNEEPKHVTKSKAIHAKKDCKEWKRIKKIVKKIKDRELRFVTYLTVTGHPKTIRTIMDMSATYNLIGFRETAILKVTLEDNCEKKYIISRNTQHKVYGSTNIVLTFGGRSIEARFFIVKRKGMQFGTNAMSRLGFKLDIFNNRLVTANGRSFINFLI